MATSLVSMCPVHPHNAGVMCGAVCGRSLVYLVFLCFCFFYNPSETSPERSPCTVKVRKKTQSPHSNKTMNEGGFSLAPLPSNLSPSGVKRTRDVAWTEQYNRVLLLCIDWVFILPLTVCTKPGWVVSMQAPPFLCEPPGLEMGT